MQPFTFTVNQTKQTLEQQWSGVLKLAQDKKLSVLKRFLTHLLICTGLYLFLYFFTAAGSSIVFKSICTIVLALAYCIILVRYSLQYLYNLKRKRLVKADLDSTPELSYLVLIDEDDVTIFSAGQTYIYPWAEMSNFGVYQGTIFLINDVRGDCCLYWHQNEMGSEAFSTFLDFLQQKQIKRMF